MDENVQNTAKIMYSQLTFFRWERIFLLGLGVLQLPFIELGYLGHVWFVTHFRLELWKNIFIRNGWMKFERNTLSVQTNVGLTWLPWEKFAAQQTMNRSLWSLDKVKPLQIPTAWLFIHWPCQSNMEHVISKMSKGQMSAETRRIPKMDSRTVLI